MNYGNLLVARLRAGDRSAQEELFRLLRHATWRSAMKIVGDPAVAEDIIQEAWMEASRAIEDFKGRCRLTTWLTAIVLNLARDHRRKERRMVPLSAVEGQSIDDPLPEQGLVSTDRTPEALLLLRETAVRVHRALGSLSATQRTVLVMRGLQGASAAEVCGALSISDPVQRVRLSRARATLRRSLEDDCPVRRSGPRSLDGSHP